MFDEVACLYQKHLVDLIPLLEVAGGAFRERFASRGLKLQFSRQTVYYRIWRSRIAG